MDTGGKSVRDPAVTHQPSKAELEEDVRIDSMPEALAWAVTRGGADRRQGDGEPVRSRTAKASDART